MAYITQCGFQQGTAQKKVNLLKYSTKNDKN